MTDVFLNVLMFISRVSGRVRAYASVGFSSFVLQIESNLEFTVLEAAYIYAKPSGRSSSRI